MSNMKILFAVVLVFSLLLSACASADNQNGSDSGAIGTDAVGGVLATDTLSTGVANDNTDLGDLNDNANANDNDAMGTPAVTDAALETATVEAIGTPLGAAEGAATEAAAMVTPVGTAEVPAVTEPMTTATPDSAAVTATPGMNLDEDLSEGFVGGMLLSDLLGQPVRLDDGDVDGAAPLDPNANTNTTGANANDNVNANANTNGNANETIDSDDDNVLTDLGVVDSVVVNQDCRVLYVLVRSSEDGRLVPVPLPALYNADQAGTISLPLTLDVTPELWAGAPGWEVDAIPDMTVSDWDADLSTYWAGLPSGETDANDNTNTSPMPEGANTGGAVRITDPTDINATNPAGEDLGDIEDIVVSLDNQQISYVILAVGGILDFGERLIPVPCDRVSWEAVDMSDNPSAVLDIDADLIENAPVIDALPDAFDSGWDADWQTYWAAP